MERTKKGVSTRLLLRVSNLLQNDLSLHGQSANLFMYADDHQMYTSDNDILKATQTLRRHRGSVTMVQGKPPASQPSEIPVPYYGSTTFQENPWV